MPEPDRPATPGVHRGFPVDELVADLRLACLSRAIDDSEIRMQKQSRVFFQISGAGHEALGLGLARHLRPAYDWFFPYYRDQALCLGLGVTATDILLQAVGLRGRPQLGRAPDAVALGQRRPPHRDPVQPDRQPVHPGGGVRGGGPLHRAPARAPRLFGTRRRAHLREPG